MTTNEIRQAFLTFFEAKGHSIVDSSSLIPAGDPTLLFANAGMVQFKDVFLGSEKRPYSRATTCQKCLRISGKHNDLENVGRTARHHTFFEMLGNFSFGDYFKEDAIKYAWEFLTVTMGLPKERLWVSIYKDDDEADKLWREHTDVFEGRILRFGEKDNFWAMGDTGPCGPCSEIHYYLGDDVKNQSEEAFRKDDGTYMEIWNLVFMQFNRDPSGALNPLPKPSVDTGMGLERIAVVKQGAQANYDGDGLRNIIAFTEKLCGKPYLGKDYTERDPEKDKQYAYDVAMRVIADHVRASSFLVADGVNPSSDGRGYVLRRLIRRACRHGRNLGFKEAFLFKVAGELIESMSEVYPQLTEHREKIQNIIKGEEEKFLVTLDTGLGVLTKEVAVLKKSKSSVLPGSVAFMLHDTYGFPLDMTEDILRTQGFSVDSEGFRSEMEQQRERSRSARANETELILQRSVKPTACHFVGYEYDEYESTVAALFDETGSLKKASVGQEIALVSKETPFYAESGGQVGDTGAVSANGAALNVIDTQKVAGDTIVHICKVTDGEIAPGDNIRLTIEKERRDKTRVNHSATHLLHLALREVLGDHVKQAGSRVSDTSLRFDFSHFEPITSEQLETVESIVNAEILQNYDVVTEVLPIEEAKKSGAVALFGEKYGDTVRVVQIGPRSREFCGGTHAARSGDLGLLTLIAEGSVSSGTRRVEAVAGQGAFRRHLEQKRLLRLVSQSLKTGEHDLEERIAKLAERNRELEREVAKAGQVAMVSKGEELVAAAHDLGGVKVVASLLDKASPKVLREVADDVRSRIGSGCVALASVREGKLIMLTAVTDDLVNRFHAGNLIKEMSEVVGSKGGGRADMAQAGGGDPTKADLALQRFQELLS